MSDTRDGRRWSVLVAVWCVATLLGCESPTQGVQVFNGQGEIAGEVTTNSVILQSRLTASERPVDGDLPGAPGFAQFEVSTTSDFESSIATDWMAATADSDYIVKTRVGQLQADTLYSYRLIFGSDRTDTSTGQTRTFRTLAGADIARDVTFTVVTGMNYNSFFHGPRAYGGPDKDQGYPALATMLDMRPDFFVATGDNVYYDSGADGPAQTPAQLRKKWHEQLAQPRMVDFLAAVPTYWEKDDHDYRYNDADNTTDRAPLPQLGARMFLEQVPVWDMDQPDPRTYRTHRVTQDLQIWLTEGREYRSPNTMPDGPDKTMWGAEQRKWLERTLLESDATFKILISPTPFIGPDDAWCCGPNAAPPRPPKNDNHSDEGGFLHERDDFFGWVLANDLLMENFYIIVGDRHWQYHSVHQTGIEEFSTGALVDANSRPGRRPGDPLSTDPDALIDQRYTYDEPTGGFLHVTITAPPEPVAAFRFYDERGQLLYEEIKASNQASP